MSELDRELDKMQAALYRGSGLQSQFNQLKKFLMDDEVVEAIETDSASYNDEQSDLFEKKEDAGTDPGDTEQG